MGPMTAALVGKIQLIEVDVVTVGGALLALGLVIYGYWVVTGMIEDREYIDYHTGHYDGRRWIPGEGDGRWDLGE